MTVEDDRDNSPLEEQIFGVILLVPLVGVHFNISYALTMPESLDHSPYATRSH
jgi:hypothetical protein